MSRLCYPRLSRSRQAGAAIIEFAIVAMVFLTVLIGIMEFGRWMFTLNAASEATRLGARLAVVCGKSTADQTFIKSRMRYFISSVPETQISIVYSPNATCDPDWSAGTNRCQSVSVSLSGATFTTLIPFLGGTYPIPSFTTTLTREFMSSTGNPVCS